MVIILKRENSIKFWALEDISVSGLAWDGRWPERGRLFLRLRNSEVEFQGQASKPGRAEDQRRRPAEQTFKSLRNCFRLLAEPGSGCSESVTRLGPAS